MLSKSISPEDIAALREQLAVLLDALRWANLSASYHAGMRDLDTAGVMVEVGRSFVNDDLARFLFGDFEWAEQVRRLRELAGRIEPAGSPSPALIESFTKSLKAEARERLWVASMRSA